MGFNIFLSIFLILQFFFIFIMSVGISTKIIAIEKQIQTIDKIVQTQTEIMQVQNNFLESFLKSALMTQREAASGNNKGKKKKES